MFVLPMKQSERLIEGVPAKSAGCCKEMPCRSLAVSGDGYCEFHQEMADLRAQRDVLERVEASIRSGRHPSLWWPVVMWFTFGILLGWALCHAAAGFWTGGK